MALNGGRITIIGCGPGARECVTRQALDAVVEAGVLVGAPRLLELFPEAAGLRIPTRGNAGETIAAIEAHSEQAVAILVTGDPGIASLARPVLRHFGLARCRVIAGISSVQVAFARLGLDWTGARILSAHATLPEVSIAALANERVIAVLAGSSQGVQWTAALMDRLGEGWTAYLAENLTLADERIRELAPGDLTQIACSTLSVFIFVRSEQS